MVTCDFRIPDPPFYCRRHATHRYTVRSDSWPQQYACDEHAAQVLANLRLNYSSDDIVDEPRPPRPSR